MKKQTFRPSDDQYQTIYTALADYAFNVWDDKKFNYITMEDYLYHPLVINLRTIRNSDSDLPPLIDYLEKAVNDPRFHKGSVSTWVGSIVNPSSSKKPGNSIKVQIFIDQVNNHIANMNPFPTSTPVPTANTVQPISTPAQTVIIEPRSSEEDLDEIVLEILALLKFKKPIWNAADIYEISNKISRATITQKTTFQDMLSTFDVELG